MTFSPVRLDHKGIATILRENPQIVNEINKLVDRIGDDVKDAADDPDAVFVKHYTTDREAGSVAVPASWQATDGALTRAAAKAGLEVKSK